MDQSRTRNTGTGFGTTGGLETRAIVNTITGQISDLSKLSQLPQIDPTQVQGLMDVMHYHNGKRITRLEVWESKQAFDQAKRSPSYQDHQQQLSKILTKVQNEPGELISLDSLQQ